MPDAIDILEVLRRAAADTTRDLSTDALADISGWSPSHLHRAFRGVAMETPKTWTTRVRLARALELLMTNNESLAIVAVAAGFASHEVMTRTFKRVLGISPSALRSRNDAAHLHHAACLALYHLPLHPSSHKRRDPMSVTVTVETRAPQPVLSMTRTTAADGLQKAMAECLPAVFMHCQSHGIAMAGPPFTRYLAMTRGTFTIAAGMPITAPGSDAGEGDTLISAGELPGGEIAVAIHAGPYQTLGETHAALEAWVAAQGRTAAGPPWETYITDPGEVPNPADWRTEVCLPLGCKVP